MEINQRVYVLIRNKHNAVVTGGVVKAILIQESGVDIGVQLDSTRPIVRREADVFASPVEASTAAAGYLVARAERTAQIVRSVELDQLAAARAVVARVEAKYPELGPYANRPAFPGKNVPTKPDAALTPDPAPDPIEDIPVLSYGDLA
jgi:hypothetical protein